MSEQKKQDFRLLVERYLEGVRSAYSDGGGTEHSGRTALEDLLKGCASLWGKDVRVQQEPRQVKGKAPDFKISRRGMVIGYVETKKPGANCEEVARSEQIEKYKTLNKNILITNYHDFFWLESGKPIALCFEQDFLDAEKKVVLRDDNWRILEEHLNGFFGVAYEKIGSAKDLAEKLAIHCHSLRNALERSLEKQERREIERDRIFGIYEGFTEKISSELTLPEFADAFAQTLGYGTLLARLNAEQEEITLDNAKSFIPDSFTLIGELVKFIDELKEEPYREVGWIVEAILSVINNLDLYEIKKGLNFYNPLQTGLSFSTEEKELYEKDPFIYFYENFLNAYDAKQRKQRGVYYTPAPIVNFIVRGIDDMLKNKFNLDTGLANSRVTALDFACGTGTFLLETIKQIFHNSDKNLAQKTLDEHICENVFGFEYLVAAYTVAHLKLSQYLSNKGTPLKKQQRLKIYLTNTLANFDIKELTDKENYVLRRLSEEGKEAQKIKNKKILVIMGNPPYAGHSINKGKDIINLVRHYTEGYPELRKPAQGKWLQDDYVKFIRFAQNKMDQTEEGIVGIITNHGFIDNITFRGMRKSLLQTFNQIYVLDLHGSAFKGLISPEGIKDENIFKIKQGVTISFFVKKAALPKKVYHCDWWGTREAKFGMAKNENYENIKWIEVKPEQPYYFFVSGKSMTEYLKFWSVPNIFACSGDPAPGIITTQDQFAISFTKEELINKIKILLKTKDEYSARQNFRLCSQSQWNYLRAKKSLDDMTWKKSVTKITYRPFDIRSTVFNNHVAVHLRRRVMRNMIGNSNLGLITVRQASFSETWQHVGITDKICEGCAISNKGREINYLFPLYLYAYEKSEKTPQSLKLLFGSANPFNGKERIENIHPAFRQEINKKYGVVFTPEKIFFYIYAVLHSPFYRKKYQEFLRIDFPRIPFPDDKQSFLDLAKIGEQLKEAHLLEKIPNITIRYEGEGKGENNHKVTKINFSHEKLYINPNQYFTPVEPEIWNFQIGGYQVLNKYLKERKGRKLSLEEIEHIKKIVASLTETRSLMEQIDPIAKKFI